MRVAAIAAIVGGALVGAGLGGVGEVGQRVAATDAARQALLQRAPAERGDDCHRGSEREHPARDL